MFCAPQALIQLTPKEKIPHDFVLGDLHCHSPSLVAVVLMISQIYFVISDKVHGKKNTYTT